MVKNLLSSANSHMLAVIGSEKHLEYLLVCGKMLQTSGDVQTFSQTKQSSYGNAFYIQTMSNKHQFIGSIFSCKSDSRDSFVH